MTAARAKVVWLGTVPDAIREALADRGLELVAETEATRVVALAQQEGRAVIIHVPSVPERLEALLSELVGPCRDAGTLVLLATDDRHDRKRLAAINQAQSAIGKRFTTGKPALFVLSEPNAPTRLSEACKMHDPGPSLAMAPQLGPAALVEGLEPAFRCLLERAFHGMSRAELSEFRGGRSNARVFRVEGFDLDGRKHVPLIAKVDRADRIDQEILNIEAFVRPYVQHWCYAALIRERCMRGARDAVLVGSFLAGARPLDEYLEHASAPATLITALFEGPLRTWRENARVDVPIQLGRAYRDWGVLQRDPSLLREAYKRTLDLGRSALSPDEILKILDELPGVRVKIRMTHGDLQARNIFVLDGRHVFLIDFHSTKHEAAMSRDPATLDVTLAFDPKAGLDAAGIAALYRAPVLHAATGIFPDPWRTAIAQVRAQSARDGITDWEYDVSVACYLLRMARLGVQFGELSDEQISIAYSLASQLAASLRDRLPPASLL